MELQNEELTLANSRPEPVLPPLQPHSGSPSLLLAELCRRSNKITNKAIDLSKPVEGDPLDSRGDDAVRGQAGSSPPPDLVAAYYLEALAEDGWLWEAWTGICDSGEPFPDSITRRAAIH